MKGISIFNALGFVSCAALMSACGNMYGNTTYVPQASYSSSSLTTSNTGTTNSLSSVQEGNYTCPALDSPNVKPQYGVASTVNGYFRVCVDPNSEVDVKVDGTFGNQDQVCVFPVEATSAGTDQEYAYWEPNPQSGAPWYICQGGSSAGTVFNFPNLAANWNAAYIVDGAYVTAMQTCLIYGAGTLECPSYPQFSYGMIR